MTGEQKYMAHGQQGGGVKKAWTRPTVERFGSFAEATKQVKTKVVATNDCCFGEASI